MVRLHNVKFDSQGGSSIDPQVTNSEGKIPQLDDLVPVREGWVFQGWWTAPSGGEQRTSDSVVFESVLFAHWTYVTPQKVIITPSEVTLWPGDQMTLEVTTEPHTSARVTWSSSDSDIVKVNSSGLIVVAGDAPRE